MLAPTTANDITRHTDMPSTILLRNAGGVGRGNVNVRRRRRACTCG